MKRKLILFSLLLIGFEGRGHTPNRGAIHASFGPVLFRSHNISTREPDRTTNVGFSLVAEGDVDYNGGLEIGFSYLRQPYTLRDGLKVNIEETKRIYATIGYRHWIDSYHSLGLLFFSSYSMGDPQVIHTDYPMTDRPDSSAQDIAEYGFDFSAQREIPLRGRWSFVFDGRYSLSLTSKKREDSNFYGVFFAAKYLFQNKSKGIEPPQSLAEIEL